MSDKDENQESEEDSELSSDNQEVKSDNQDDDKTNSKENENKIQAEEEINLEIDPFEKERESLLTKISDLQDKYLNVLSDTENFKKRMIREQQKAIELANEKIIFDILPVVDNLQRAIESGYKNKDFESFYQGVVMIEKDFVSKLENWGLSYIPVENKEFNPQVHEAYAMEEVESLEKETVIEELQKGYTLKDKVLRTSKVKVGKPKINTK